MDYVSDSLGNASMILVDVNHVKFLKLMFNMNTFLCNE